MASSLPILIINTIIMFKFEDSMNKTISTLKKELTHQNREMVRLINKLKTYKDQLYLCLSIVTTDPSEEENLVNEIKMKGEEIINLNITIIELESQIEEMNQTLILSNNES